MGSYDQDRIDKIFDIALRSCDEDERLSSHSVVDRSKGSGIHGGVSAGTTWEVLCEEDGGRSDSEDVFFFDDINVASEAFGAAKDMGLVGGEVTLDLGVNEKFGVGKYAIRMAPHVRATKPDIFFRIAEIVMDFAEFGTEVYEELISDSYGDLHEINPFHAAPRKGAGGVPGRGGQFVSKSQLARAGKGSYSVPGKKKKKVKASKKGIKLLFTKNPCGRAARDDSRDVRCFSGSPGEWSQKLKVLKGKRRKTVEEFLSGDVFEAIVPGSMKPTVRSRKDDPGMSSSDQVNRAGRRRRAAKDSGLDSVATKVSRRLSGEDHDKGCDCEYPADCKCNSLSGELRRVLFGDKHESLLDFSR